MIENELIYATTNKAKVISFQKFIMDYRIKIVQFSLKLPESRSNDVKEIAIGKVKYAFNKIEKPVLVSDVAFNILSLNNFPGTYINFILNTIGTEGLLKLVNDKRNCEFIECLAYLDSSLYNPKFFISKTIGTLSTIISETKKQYLLSDLGRIFIPAGSKKTISAMNDDEYLEWNNNVRRKTSAYSTFIQWYNSYMKKMKRP